MLAVLVLLLTGIERIIAADPPQYGTPFAGVPDPRDVNMYQVHIRPYSAAGNFAGVTARLDAIKALGINVIYLMPFYPTGTDARSSNSPYCVKDFTSIASEYGTLNDLRALVDGAHSRGMAVMIDWIANQTSWDHAWITQHPDWYIRVNGVIQQCGPFPDVAGLDFNSSAMRSEMINCMRYWVFAANIDGFRFDYANNPPLDFWSQAITNLRGISNRKLLLFAEGDRLENFTVGFDLNFGDKWYYDVLKPIANGSSVSLAQNTTNIEYTYANETQQVVRYTANHDTETNETAIGVFKSHAGVCANFVVSACMRGVPFLTSGQEVDFNQTIPWPYTTVKINWNTNPSAATEFGNILKARSNSTAIRRGTLTNYSSTNVCAFTKSYGTEKVTVIVNMRNNSSTYTIPSALAGTYTGMISGEVQTLTSGSTITLNAFQYYILSNTASNVPVTGVSISPTSTSVAAGTAQQLTAAVLPSNATNKTVSWSSSNNGVASVNSNGVVSALSAGSATITVRTADGGYTANCVVTVTSTGGALPTPWATSDLGAVAATGSASYSGSTFTVNGSGADIWGTTDEFRYVYQQVSGDVTITARVASMTNTDGWAKAGVMLRNGLASNAAHAYSAVTAGNGLAFQYRTTAGGASSHIGGPSGAAPYWVRLVRSGNTITSYVSTNGSSWTSIGSQSFSFSTVYVGMAVTSHNDGTICSATFDNVSVTTSANVPVTGVSVSPTSISLSTGVTSQLTATVVPSNATNKNVSWTSNNSGVASVNSSGLVTAIAPGTATITVTTADGGRTATCAVNVTAPATTYYAIRNRWRGTYLYDAGAYVRYGSSIANNSYLWEKVTIDATYFWLKNAGTGEYMHIENQTGYVQCTAATLDWWSGQWSADYIDGTWNRIRNRWQTSNMVHVESQNGYAQYANAQDGWWSAQWQFVPSALKSAFDNTADMEELHAVNLYPNPVAGKTLTIETPGHGQCTMNLSVYSLAGELVFMQPVNSGNHVYLDIPNGMYILKIQSDNISFTKKIIVY